MMENTNQLQSADENEDNIAKIEPQTAYRMKNQVSYRKLSNSLPTIYENHQWDSPSKTETIGHLEQKVTELTMQIKALGKRAARDAVVRKKFDINGKENKLAANTKIFHDNQQLPADINGSTAVPERLPLGAIDGNQTVCQSVFSDSQIDK